MVPKQALKAELLEAVRGGLLAKGVIQPGNAEEVKTDESEYEFELVVRRLETN